MKKITTLIISLLLIAATVIPMASCSSATTTPATTTITTTATLTQTSAAATLEAGALLTPQKRLKIATTTSLYDTGLWAYLEPQFEQEYNVQLDVLYAGSGKAMEWGQRGDVDVLAVHAKSVEEKFVADGYGVKRVPFAYNHFLIVGPESDPAGIKGMKPEDAFKQLFASGNGTFISRGDKSGTHVKEQEIWKAAGYDYESQVRKASAWYLEAGSGMGPTLQMASEKGAYTLTDIGTYLAFKSKLSLATIVDKGSILLNVYSVIAVNPEKVTGVNSTMAQNMVTFLTSDKIQQAIGAYGTALYGQQLFTPCAGNEPTE
jgi:tungstate transport system substrate-binding protein